MIRQAQSTIFINGNIHNTQVKFLLDTGSSVTILHPQTWELLPHNIRQTLQVSTKSIVAAEGSTLNVVGSAEVVIRFGKLVRRHVIYVAPITQAGILGLDFLSSHEGILDIPKKS